ncbi:hypothetical protein [Acinetobacter entericus]|uniref:Uncharacterized protein n=1 Tax=Acinetobacter entericus TaxID=2989714 RepID=A0ABT3NN97_9GAMM|nr:hypothetical protein [Acinetobacter entericus]MCW8041035.1 hypothetical protein [Acinetobacter entericus]
MKKILLIAALLLPTLAIAAPKGVNVSTSNFDGAKEVTLKPYGTSSCIGFGKTCISVGALWRSASPEVVALDLHTLGVFVNMTNLAINIDGQIIKAEKVTLAFDHTLTGHYKQSFQRFIITKSDFDKIVAAQKVWLKISTIGGSYIETNLIDNGKTTLARDGLIRFSTEI